MSRLPMLGLVLLVGTLTVGHGRGAEPGPADLVGSVVDEAGRPVVGARVVARFGGRSEVRTGNSGVFRLAFTAADIDRVGELSGSLMVRETDGRLGIVLVRQKDGRREPIRIVVKPARALAVVAVDAGGRGVADASVEFADGTRTILGGRTDETGRCALAVPSDLADWRIAARKGGAGFDYAAARRIIESTDLPAPLPAEVRLKLDGARSLRIKVVARSGWPVSGAWVSPIWIKRPDDSATYQFGRGIDRGLTTGPDGTVLIDWLPGRVEAGPGFWVESDRFSMPGLEVRPAPARPDEPLVVTMLPKERLSGRVTLADGRAAADATIRATGQGSDPTPFHAEARTDAQGRYSMNVGSEAAYLVVAGLDDLAVSYRGHITVRAGRASDGEDLVLGPATKIRGRVTTDPRAVGVPNAALALVADRGPIPLELRDPKADQPPTIATCWHARTDAEGSYEIRVGPGDYRLTGPQGGEPVRVTIPGINPPAEVRVDFRLPGDGGGPGLQAANPGRGPSPSRALEAGVVSSQR